MSLDGMDDMVVARSAITSIDGRRGELRYRGYAVGDLADLQFEAVAALLWSGELPEERELDELKRELREIRCARTDLVRLVADVPPDAHPLDVLRMVVSWDAIDNPRAWEGGRDVSERTAREMTAWFPLIPAALQRKRAGLPPVEPRPDLDTAASFLYALYGRLPDPDAVATLNSSLVLHADHELNASTFAARVTIATQSNLHAAVASALGTLAGPRHGGASDRIIGMLREIGSAELTRDWVHGELQQRRRIMGFGHRVYRTTDPRAAHLRRMAVRLLSGGPNEEWVHILDELERVMDAEKHLYPNVDLYAAVVNHALGIQPAFYTSVFALSRIVGWTAHAMEGMDGRLVRPVAQYVGPLPRRLETPALP